MSQFLRVFLPTLARESDEIKIKDKISALKSKRAARKSADFKTKESCAKRAVRDITEFKQKELELQRKSKKKARLAPYILEKERITKEEWRSNTRNKKTENMSDCKRKASKRRSTLFSTKEKTICKV